MTVTLNGGISASAIHLLVNAAVADPAPYYQIGSEVLRIESYFENEADGALKLVPNYTRWTVERGQVGTTKATHADGATMTPLYPQVGNPAIDTGGGAAEPGTVVVTPPNEVDIGAALDAAMQVNAPSEANPYVTLLDIGLATLLSVDNDAGLEVIVNLGDPTDPQDAATKAYADALPAQALADVLAAGNDTGGVEFVHVPAVDVDALAGVVVTATGAGFADAHQEANGETGGADAAGVARAVGGGDANNIITGAALAETVDGDAFAAIHATATGDGNTDACTYARSVDGQALADNDALASGTGDSDAGCYANAVDGTANAAGYAATTGTGVATAGATATGTGGTAGMTAVADAVSGRMGFNGVTPIVRPELPASPTEQDIADVLVALGLVTQAA